MAHEHIYLDLDRWTHIDYLKWSAARARGDNRYVFSKAQDLIARWDYTVDLADPKAIYKIGVEESAEVVRTVADTLNKYIDEASFEEVKVNFRGWDTERFFEFAEAQVAGEWAKAEAMIREVATLEGVQADKPLSFAQGVKLNKAVNDKYKKIVTGKN